MSAELVAVGLIVVGVAIALGSFAFGVLNTKMGSGVLDENQSGAVVGIVIGVFFVGIGIGVLGQQVLEAIK